jgi:hypothetical protein
MTSNDSNHIKLLARHWELLQNSLDTLIKSVEKAQAIGEKEDYTFEEMETFDSLTSKFSRTSDLFLQKIMRTLWELLHEDKMPLIDVLNRAEKLEIIHSADDMLEIRDVRNQVAHEYIPEAIQELVPEVIDLSQTLEDNINTCKTFLLQRDWLPNASNRD